MPSQYFIVDPDNFPTSLKGEAKNGEAYTYHVFVMRCRPIPSDLQTGVLINFAELAYSHYINTDANLS